MKILRLLRCIARLKYLKWAMREIDKTHEDVPMLVLAIREAEDALTNELLLTHE